MADRPLITREKLDEMLKSINPNARFDEDSAAIVMKVLDEYVDDMITKTVEVAKHKGSTTLKKEDLEYVLKHLMPKE